MSVMNYLHHMMNMASFEIFVVSSVVDWVVYIFVISQPHFMVAL
jgi:hypothetical protein